ncbi:hypothetical protein [Methanosarcina sp.]|uniref:hypothetical protein n=1 Tax=Methanosarcina sp. TaxID=2213 RepID=UPI003BB7BE80
MAPYSTVITKLLLKDTRRPKRDIPDVIERFRGQENLTDRKGKCFYVPSIEIKANNYDFSISRYKEIESEEVKYEKPGVIIEKIEELEGHILENIAELKDLLN